jgi:3-oxoacyl-[acyl-carrier protein] reductase
MDEKVALITGGVRGIGRAVALALAKRGWAIAACYRTSEKEADELEATLRLQGARAMVVRADVSDPTACEELVASVEAELGKVDALVNCAGPYHRVNLLEETPEGWQEMFDHNLHPVFYLSRAVAEGMKQRRWGRIISFAMANADQGCGQLQVTAHYIAKAGVLILTRSLAKALAPFGVTANAISPGFLASGSAPEEELAKMVKNIPAGYVGSLDDAVAAVLFLLSDEARYVNGGNIHLSGGWGV